MAGKLWATPLTSLGLCFLTLERREDSPAHPWGAGGLLALMPCGPRCPTQPPPASPSHLSRSLPSAALRCPVVTPVPVTLTTHSELLFIIHASEEKKECSSVTCTPVHLVRMIRNDLELTLAASGLHLSSAGRTQRKEKVGDHGESTGRRGCLNFTRSWPPPPSGLSGAVWIGE